MRGSAALAPSASAPTIDAASERSTNFLKFAPFKRRDSDESLTLQSLRTRRKPSRCASRSERYCNSIAIYLQYMQYFNDACTVRTPTCRPGKPRLEGARPRYSALLLLGERAERSHLAR